MSESAVHELPRGEHALTRFVAAVRRKRVVFALALAVVAALRKRAPRPPLVLIAVGALGFVAGHAVPTGPIGMALVLAGVAWLELGPRVAEPQQSAPVQPT